MKLIVVQAGRLREREVIALRDEYLKRFRRFGSLRVLEGPARWPKERCLRVLVDEHGDRLDSPGLAARLAEWTMQHGTVAFAVGAAYGHEADLRGSADQRLSLGPLTLPHQLAHLILVEQLYRAATIQAGTGYHHE